MFLISLSFFVSAEIADAAVLSRAPNNLSLAPLEVRNKVSTVTFGDLLLTGQVGYLPRLRQ